MLHLFVDTSTWLDLAKRRDGQKWIGVLQVLTRHGGVQLIVPTVVIDEFKRNRERIEASMTASVEQRFRLIKQDLGEYGGTDYESALRGLDKRAPFHRSRNSVADALLIELYATLTAAVNMSKEALCPKSRLQHRKDT